MRAPTSEFTFITHLSDVPLSLITTVNFRHKSELEDVMTNRRCRIAPG